MSARCAIYARYSSDQQREASIEDQVRVCRARAEREGWAVAGCFTDAAVSGATALRPGYQALLAAMRGGGFDLLLAESLDRLSRDQEHVAALFKQARFAGVRIVTLAEGEVTELHVGLKGTMGALYLKDLADKTRRGLEGRVRAGRSGGGLCYGYRVVRGPAPGPDGEPERGLREVDPAQAAVVRRIFREYAAGASPRRIAHGLNAEGVPGPRGGAWAASAINGDRAKGTGILNNALYAGQLVWNRRRWLKDPGTGRRLARANAEAERVVQDVPALRIVPEALWAAVKARQAALGRRPATAARGGEDADGAAPFWSQQRPRYLFSGLLRCGACGGGFVKVSAAHFGCSTAREKGAPACGNRLTVRRDVLEATVLGALRERLMDPGLFRVFVAEFTAEWNRLQAEASAGLATRRQGLARVEQQIGRLVDAIAEGAPAASLRERLAALERRKVELVSELASAAAPAPRLHPGLAEVYRARVASLAEALEAEDAAETRAQLRALVEAVRLVPEDGRLRIEVRGALGAILRLASPGGRAAGPDDVAEVFVEQIKRDAGTGFEPVTFRL